MSYLFNNPQGLKGDLVIAGDLTVQGIAPGSSSTIVVSKVESAGALTLDSSTGPVLAEPTVVAATAPVAVTASQQVAIDPIDTNFLYCYSPVNVGASALGAAAKIKVTIQWALATNDSGNNSLWECGVLVGQATGAGAQVAKATPGISPIYLVSNTGITHPTNSGNFASSSGSASIILTKGVDYAAGANIAGFVTSEPSYPVSRVVDPSGVLQAYLRVTIEPLF